MKPGHRQEAERIYNPVLDQPEQRKGLPIAGRCGLAPAFRAEVKSTLQTQPASEIILAELLI
jgi:hypothetical protein